MIRNKDYYGIGLFLLLAVMIGYQQMVSPAIGIFLLVVLLEGLILKSLRFRFNKLTALLIVLFLFYLLGLAWAEHKDVGLKLLEYKMSFFIFPVLFFFVKESTNIWSVLLGLVLGCIILAVRFFAALYFYDGEPLPGFEISRQIIDLHPSYTSIYFTMASVLLIYGYVTKRLNWSIFIIIPLVSAFCYLIFLMGSFAAILFLGLCLAIGFGLIIYHWLKWIGLIVYIFICPIILYFSILKIDKLKYDIEMVQAAYSEISEGKKSFLEKNKFVESGTKERVMMWYLSAEIIAENPFGVGTGDIDFFLVDKCEKYDLALLKKKNLNPHNQFLQIGIDLGIPGLLFLVFLVGAIIYFAIKNKNYFLFFLGFSLLFNGLFESVLQRQSGIVFYSCVICLAVVYTNQLGTNKKTLADKI